MENYKTKEVNISEIKPGDTVFHNGETITVCASDIRNNYFMGKSVFGDCYHSGHKPVLLVEFNTVRPIKINS